MKVYKFNFKLDYYLNQAIEEYKRENEENFTGIRGRRF